MLHKAVAFGAITIAADVVMDPGAQRAPFIDWSLKTVLLHPRDGPVDSNPGHQLRMGEVPPRPAHLPDAAVGLAPFLGDKPHQHPLHTPRVSIWLNVILAGDMQRVHQL